MTKKHTFLKKIKQVYIFSDGCSLYDSVVSLKLQDKASILLKDSNNHPFWQNTGLFSVLQTTNLSTFQKKYSIK